MRDKIRLDEAIRFHGHLGPYLVLGLLAGELALKKLKAKKYFGLRVKVYGANKRPRTCLIDGLQLSTGATYGKGNINKYEGFRIKIEFYNRESHKRIILTFKGELNKRLGDAKTHKDSELLARKLYGENRSKLFKLITYNL